MPPPWLRRPVSVTAWLLMSTLALIGSPLLLAGAELASLVRRDDRPRIAARVVLAYFLRELTTLVACGGLWVASGCGLWMQTRRLRDWHWRLLGWFVGGLANAAFRTVQIRVAEEGTEEALQKLSEDGPVLVFSRHAGPADTVLLIDRLLRRFERRPSVVFKEAIALDPSVDLISHRLPHAVLDTDDREQCEARIVHAAESMGQRGALLLFPEGGNFSPERRLKALGSLRRRGHRQAAQRGEQMHHVLPPRPSGALCALDAAPDAPVVFAAHTGLGLAAYPREIWRELPVGGTLHTRMWLVARDEVPSDNDARCTWLNDWFQRIDDWIDVHGTEPSAGRSRPRDGASAG
ncbi:MAG TPA: 1-acyl-sn-glycerol-3-phosphate acyltransferase [Solirubrobacteraceae bacterium]|jgi:1-acyl-sn-glycerol-3-phosphate acyltransferase|nr:1-acyl-sn-glycerol-3-phosphate acyltransferase [Solirubrobacteraceae bacterium]